MTDTIDPRNKWHDENSLWQVKRERDYTAGWRARTTSDKSLPLPKWEQVGWFDADHAIKCGRAVG